MLSVREWILIVTALYFALRYWLERIERHHWRREAMLWFELCGREDPTFEKARKDTRWKRHQLMNGEDN